jgi:hypothetical protein
MRWLRVGLFVLLALMLMASSAGPTGPRRLAGLHLAAAVSRSQARHIGRSSPVVLRRRVDAGQLPPARLGGPIQTEPEETGPKKARPPRTAGVVALEPRKIGRRTATIASIVGGASVPGLTIDGKVPPDLTVAAGTTRIIETVNDSAQVFDHAGTSLGTFDLGTLFDGVAGEGTDPKVAYDAPSRTFFMVYLTAGLAGGASEIDLGVATDPLGAWTIYDVHNEGRLQDQPKLGISSDKVTISWNDNGNSGPEEYKVIQKSGLVAHHGTVPGSIWGPDSSRLNVVPAIQLSSGNTAFAIFHNYGSATVGLMAFTGTPGVSAVSFTETDRGVARTSAPPNAAQPRAAAGKASPRLDTGDDRLESAVWRAGNLWASGNDTCRYRTDTSSRSCLRLIHVLTAGMTVARDVDITMVGADVMYPAVVLDRSNDIWISFSSASTSQFAAAEVAEADAGAIGASIGANIYATGTGSIDYSGCTTDPRTRFGDYLGAASDPAREGQGVWVGGEFGVAGCSWGTQVAAFTP